MGPQLDMQTIINAGVGLAIAVAGWFARELWGAVSELRKDLHAIETDLPRSYVRRDEFGQGIREIKETLTRILDKLDEKMDKERT